MCAHIVSPHSATSISFQYDANRFLVVLFFFGLVWFVLFSEDFCCCFYFLLFVVVARSVSPHGFHNFIVCICISSVSLALSLWSHNQINNNNTNHRNDTETNRIVEISKYIIRNGKSETIEKFNKNKASVLSTRTRFVSLIYVYQLVVLHQQYQRSINAQQIYHFFFRVCVCVCMYVSGFSGFLLLLFFASFISLCVNPFETI